MLKYLLRSVSLILYSGTVYAACGSDCKIPPTCSQMGYRQDISCPEGFITCPFDSSYKWCKEYTCADGRYQDAPLPAQEGYSCSPATYHGHTCYDCTCAPQAGKCRYNASNKGSGGVLSSPCCNGNYDTCSSLCNNSFTTELPAYADMIDTCDACGTTYYNWSCKSGYIKNAAGTACVADNCSGYTLDGCPSTAASCSECLNGTTKKYKINRCKDGYTISGNTCVVSCSDYPLTSCPIGATGCIPCSNGTKTKYKIIGCKNGYTKVNYTCWANSCTGYTLTRCPTEAMSCSECLSGTTKKYKIEICKNGYMLSGNNCVAY